MNYDYSLVIPFYNEALNAGALIREVLDVLPLLGGTSEVILVNDGSRDDTLKTLQEAAGKHHECMVLSSPTNRGQAPALYAGLIAAAGRVIITMDGDGQNVPADIPSLLARLSGVDMVVGIRQNRQDTAIRRLMSRGANYVRSWILRDGMRDSGCALKVFRREIVPALIPIRTLYSFIPAMAVGAGFRVAQAPVQHRARAAGTSNYGFRAFLWRPLVDMLGVSWYQRRAVPLAGIAQDMRRITTQPAAEERP